MDWIIEFLVKCISNIILSLIAYIGDTFGNVMSINGRETLNAFWLVFMPSVATNEANNPLIIMQGLGLLILYAIMIFQIFKAFGGNINKSEDPVRIICKTALFTLLTVYAPKICIAIFEFAQAPYKLITEINYGSAAASANWTSGVKALSDPTLFSSEVDGTISNLALDVGADIVSLLLSVGLLCMIFQAYLRLALEVVERYVLTGCLTLFSPLVMACGASDATSRITATWIRVMFSQMILMCASVFFMAVADRAIANITTVADTLSGADGLAKFGFAGHKTTAVLLCEMMIVAWMRIGSQFDNHMQTLGASALRAGDGLYADMMMGYRTGKGLFHAAGGLARGAAMTGGALALGMSGRGSEGRLKGLLNDKQAMKGVLNANKNGLAGLNDMRMAKNQRKNNLAGNNGAVKNSMAAALATGQKTALGQDALQALTRGMASTADGRALNAAGLKAMNGTIDGAGNVQGTYETKDGHKGTFTARANKDGSVSGFAIAKHNGGAADPKSSCVNGQGMAAVAQTADGEQAEGNIANLADTSGLDTEGQMAGITMPAGMVNEDGQVGMSFDENGELREAKLGSDDNYDINGQQFSLDQNGNITSIGEQQMAHGGIGMTTAANESQQALMRTDENGNMLANAGVFNKEDINQLGAEAVSGEKAMNVSGQTIASPDISLEDASRFVTQDGGAARVQNADTVSAGTLASAGAINRAQKAGLVAGEAATSKGAALTDRATGRMSVDGVAVTPSKKNPDMSFSGPSKDAFASAQAGGTNMMSLMNAEGSGVEAALHFNSDGTVDTRQTSSAAMSVGQAAGLIEKDASGNMVAAPLAAGQISNGMITLSAGTAGKGAHRMAAAGSAGIDASSAAGRAMAAAISSGKAGMGDFKTSGVPGMPGSTASCTLYTTGKSSTAVDAAATGAAAIAVMSALGYVAGSDSEGYHLTPAGCAHMSSDGDGVSMSVSAGTTTTLGAAEAFARAVDPAGDGIGDLNDIRADGVYATNGMIRQQADGSSVLCASASAAADGTLSGNAAQLAVLESAGYAAGDGAGHYRLTSAGESRVDSTGTISHTALLRNADFSAGDTFSCGSEAGARLVAAGMAQRVPGSDGTQFSLTDKGAMNMHQSASGFYVDSSGGAAGRTVSMENGSIAQARLAVCAGGEGKGIAYINTPSQISSAMQSGTLEREADGALRVSEGIMPKGTPGSEYITNGSNRIDVQRGSDGIYRPAMATQYASGSSSIGVPLSDSGMPDIIPSSFQYVDGACKFQTSAGDTMQFAARPYQKGSPVPSGSMRIGDYLISQERGGSSSQIQCLTPGEAATYARGPEDIASVCQALNNHDTSYRVTPVDMSSTPLHNASVYLQKTSAGFAPVSNKELREFDSSKSGAEIYMLQNYRRDQAFVPGSQSTIFDQKMAGRKRAAGRMQNTPLRRKQA